MPLLPISEVARQIGLKPSAIRYYEQIGILPPAQRRGGQRRYDVTVLYRLAIVQRARQMGFSLDEIKQLFFGFRKVTTASERWKKLSQQKLQQLEVLSGQIKEMQNLLESMITRCHCSAFDQCGKGIFDSWHGKPAKAPKAKYR